MPRGRRRCERASLGAPWVGSGGRSVEDGADGAGALQLEEAGRARDEETTVPEPAGRVTLRGGGDDGAEERHAVDGDDRGADLVADEADAPLVAGPQLLVDVGQGGEAGEVLGQAHL